MSPLIRDRTSRSQIYTELRRSIIMGHRVPGERLSVEKLAESYGAMGLRATKPSEVVPIIKKALRSPKPVIMEFVVESEEGVYPMVPAGASIDKMILL